MILIQPSPSLPPSPLQQNSQLYEHLKPKFSEQWERKELNHMGPYFHYSSNSWNKGKGNQETWVVQSIHPGQSTNQQIKKQGQENIYMYLYGQSEFS